MYFSVDYISLKHKHFPLDLPISLKKQKIQDYSLKITRNSQCIFIKSQECPKNSVTSIFSNQKRNFHVCPFQSKHEKFASLSENFPEILQQKITSNNGIFFQTQDCSGNLLPVVFWKTFSRQCQIFIQHGRWCKIRLYYYYLKNLMHLLSNNLQIQ